MAKVEVMSAVALSSAAFRMPFSLCFSIVMT
jgi:hypothetical protein